MSSSSSDQFLHFLGFDELIVICLFLLPFIDILGAILETVSSRNARLFSFRHFLAAVLIFSLFARSCKVFIPVIKADFKISFDDGLTLLATCLNILSIPCPLYNTGYQ